MKLATAYHLSADRQALDSLVKRHPEAASGVGELYAASQDWGRAIDEYRKRATDPRADVALLTKLATAYQSAGRTREAILPLAQASAANPKDTILSLKVAALQAWFGQEKELADTRQRILAFAKDTNEAMTAERAAKACSILPSTDKAELDAALALARAAVKLGNGGEWNLMALGMAEYRSGNDVAAEEALLAAVKASPNKPDDAHGDRHVCVLPGNEPVSTGEERRGPRARARGRGEDEAAARRRREPAGQSRTGNRHGAAATRKNI